MAAVSIDGGGAEEAMPVNQELFRVDVVRNLQRFPNGFPGMPRPVFDPPDDISPHPLAEALRTLDAVIAAPEDFVEDPAKGARVPVLGPLATRIHPNGPHRVQFLTALGVPRITDDITPFRNALVDPWTREISRVVRTFFGAVLLVEDLVLDEDRLKTATYTAAIPPRKGKT